MGLADDWKRLDQLEHIKGTLQYGQNLQVTPGPGNPDLVLASKDLIRFVGEKTDVNAWRVYLSPWQPTPQIPIAPLIAAATYADPTPWAPPEPRNFDSFAGGGRFPLFARIMWGSGGIQHTAFVDWPRRGCLVQCSGNYVQVNAFVNVSSPGIDPRVLPLVSATLAPEPGGGDSACPATFTYRPESFDVDPVVPPYGFRNFQIPPFARAFVPVVNWTRLIGAGGLRMASIVPNLMGVAGGIGANATNVVQSWQTAFPATVGDQDRFMQPIPLSGQDAAVLRIESDAFLGTDVGCMFFLDL